MAHNTIGLGAFLTILGLGTFALVNFDPVQTSALYPAALGGVFLALGYTAFRHPQRRTATMRIAAGLSLLAFLLTLPGLVRVGRMVLGASVPHPTMALEHGVTALVCATFLIYFVATRATSDVHERV